VASLAVHERIVLRAGDRRSAVEEIIDSARSRLVLSIYRLDDLDVLAALGRARRRGVAVDVLITTRVNGGNTTLNVLAGALEAGGFSVRRYADSSMNYHAKYIVADNSLALVGSLNFTRKCFEDTCDFLLITSDSEVTTGLARLFDHDFRGPGRSTPVDLGPRLIVGPDTARERYSALIRGARRRLRFVDHKLTDPRIVALIRSKTRRVSVEVFGRDDVDPLIAHGKLLIVDDQLVVLGSIALSKKGLDRRREVAVVVRDRACVAELVHFFESFTRDAGRRSPAAPAGWASHEAV
jgi:phosphatidylserine/phosphatidylglycerophosphate/cardiolipin synthase-like enzyme